jgi:hypothetical protein
MSTALTLWEQEMAAAAVAQAASEKDTGGFKTISFKSGALAIDGNMVKGNEMNVIVLASIHENQYYTGTYNPNEPSAPVCYSFGSGGDDMVPHEDSPDKQNDACKGCWANEWASADTGKGKACKNVRRLLVISEDALEDVESLMEAEMRMMKLPVMSVKNWTTYVNNTLKEDIKRPSFGVITRVKLLPDPKSQFKVTFKFEEMIDFNQELYEAMKKRVAEAERGIVSAYPVFEKSDEPKQRKTIPIKSEGVAPPTPSTVKGKGKF